MTINRAEYTGVITIPASKSQTIRAILIALMAGGKSKIRHSLFSSDTLAAINAVKTIGVKVEESADGTLFLDSSHLTIADSTVTIDCLNSGTTAALIMPILALYSTPFIVTGDEQLKKRPFLPLLNSLRELGAEVKTTDGFLPALIKGPLKGGVTTLECKTSQYLSGLLLALPGADNDSKVTCSLLYEKPYVEMTRLWLKKENIAFTQTEDLMESHIKGHQRYAVLDEYIEGDFSSACFFFVLAAIQKKSITVMGLDRNTTQGDKRILEVLEDMGCTIEWDGMCVAVTGGEKIKGGEWDINDIPDALPALSVLACYSNERIVFKNVAQARIKETDRISVMKTELEKLGADITELPDGLVINGKGHLKGGFVSGHFDHRVIMALSIAGTKTDEETVIDNTDAVVVTFPTFYTLLKELERK